MHRRHLRSERRGIDARPVGANQRIGTNIERVHNTIEQCDGRPDLLRARNPDFSAAAEDLARLYQATGRSTDAEKVYNDLRAKKPDNVAALLGLADLATARQHRQRIPETHQ